MARHDHPGLGQGEARRRYDRLARYEPHLLAAQSQMLEQLFPKWGGSFQRAHEFARECMLAAPEGAPNGVKVVDAHIEHYGTLGGAEAAAYFASTAVRDEVYEAAARSVLHPAFGAPYAWVSIRHVFALAFCLMDDYPAAATQFLAIGDHGDHTLWRAQSSPEAFNFHRFRAMATVTA